MADDVNMLLRLMRQKRDERLGRDSPFGESGAEFAANALPIYSGIGPAVQAFNDPSLANLTNAGVRVPLSLLGIVPKMLPTAVGTGALGILEALRRDIAPELVSAANAQTKDKGKALQQDEMLPNGYTRKQLEGIAPTVGLSADALAGMARRQIQGLVVKAGEAKIGAKTKEDETATSQRQEKFDRDVKAAEAERTRILARDRRFSDTDVGKVYDAVGPAVVAGLAGAGAGFISKLGTPTGKVVYDYAIPGVLGAWAGAKAFNAPGDFNRSTEPDNQKRLAWQTYANMLPEGHTDRARIIADVEAGKYGPFENPLKQAATKDYDENFWRNNLYGAAAGVTGGVMGAEFARAPGRIIEGLAEMPGRISQAYRRGFQPSSAATAPKRGAGGRGASGEAPAPDSPTQLPPPPPAGAGERFPSPAWADYDPQLHGPISRQYLDELLTHNSSARNQSLAQADTIDNMVKQLQGRYVAANAPMVDPAALAARAVGSHAAATDLRNVLQATGTSADITRPAIRQQVLDAISGKPHTLAIPAAATGAGLLGAMSGTGQAEAGSMPDIATIIKMVESGQLPVEVLRELLPAAAGR